MSTVTWYIPGGPASSPTVETELAAGKVDHVAAALARLPQQFRGKPKIEALLTALVTPCASLEDALWQLLVERGVDSAIGAQLDQLGGVVGQERGGLSDADYRRYIRARIAANRSRGNFEDLIRVANLVINDDAATIETVTQNGTVVVRLRGVLATDSLAGVVLSFLQDSVSGGIRVVLESFLVADSDTFFTDNMRTLAGAHVIGQSALATNEPAVWGGWPSSGTVEIDSGGNLETIAFSTMDGPSVVLVSPLTKNHAGDVEIRLVAAEQSGKGLGNSSEFHQPTLTPYSALIGSTGGRMADARD